MQTDKERQIRAVDLPVKHIQNNWTWRKGSKPDRLLAPSEVSDDMVLQPHYGGNIDHVFTLIQAIYLVQGAWPSG